jgi:hypothetical protein
LCSLVTRALVTHIECGEGDARRRDSKARDAARAGISYESF